MTHDELRALAEAALALKPGWQIEDYWSFHVAVKEYQARTKPAVVLALLDEIDALRAERDKLQQFAKNVVLQDVIEEALRIERDRYREALEKIAKNTPTTSTGQSAAEFASRALSKTGEQDDDSR